MSPEKLQLWLANRIWFPMLQRTLPAGNNANQNCQTRYAIAARKEGPEPHRPTRGQPRADAPHDACNGPASAGCRTRPHLPAGAEIRERHQPHRGQPIAANLPHSSGASSVFLRGHGFDADDRSRAERISATRLPWKRVIDGPD